MGGGGVSVTFEKEGRKKHSSTVPDFIDQVFASVFGLFSRKLGQ